MPLPKVLVDQIRDGRVVLFLGAGAARGAVHPGGLVPPDGPTLAQRIAEKFLGPEFSHRPLDQVASLAISESSLPEVQAFVESIFRLFDPADFHKMVPTFAWKAIATTNYDLIIERAYNQVPKRVQQLVPFFKDGQRVDDRLRSLDAVPYLKLHGCITNIEDPNCPLILTPEQYIEHRQGRQRLFTRLEELSYEHPILFIGHSLADIDIRTILLRLSAIGHTAARCFMVGPSITDVDARFWESRRITPLRYTFDQFMHELDHAIAAPFRGLVTRAPVDHPILRHFATATTSLSDGLAAFLSAEVEYVHAGIQGPPPNAETFYKGYFADWSPIVGHLDVRRGITDTILSDVFLRDEAHGERAELIVLRGHAGSGKTVFLHRLAWEAATEFDNLCLVSREGISCSYDRIVELQDSTKKRIFLFVDDAPHNRENIEDLVGRARRHKLPLTVIAATRHNEWTAHCEALDFLMTASYELRYLSEVEIQQLVQLLEKHRSLGHLQDLAPEQRLDALRHKAGRQLLVALHEATWGKPFSDIVLDEYQSIPSPQAQALYRTICVLHRTGNPARAGLISRVHGIALSDFKDRFFAPLENIVFARHVSGDRDWVYETRHPHIAELVFERAMGDQQDRFDEYIRILSALDPDYAADREGMKALTNARELLALLPDVNLARRVFEAARSRAPQETGLFQQEAILEMNHSGGDLQRAEGILREAVKMAPHNPALAHSLAELELKRSQRATSLLEKRRLRAEARRHLGGSANRTGSSHTRHTLLKLLLDELSDALDSENPVAISEKIKEVEKALAEAVAEFPDDSHILDIDAQFSELLGNAPSASRALEAAFASNKSSPYIAMRLARFLNGQGHRAKAIEVLRESLEHRPNEKDVHYSLARLLAEDEGESHSVRHHLRHSFTRGDSRIQPQFWCARAEFIGGDREFANALFEQLASAPMPSADKQTPRAPVSNDTGVVRFSGRVTHREDTYAFLARDGDQASVYARPEWCDGVEWDAIRRHARVTFSLAFNYRGPAAVDLRLEP